MGCSRADADHGLVAVSDKVARTLFGARQLGVQLPHLCFGFLQLGNVAAGDPRAPPLPILDDALARHQNSAAGQGPLHLREAAAGADEGADASVLVFLRAGADGFQTRADQTRCAFQTKQRGRLFVAVGNVAITVGVFQLLVFRGIQGNGLLQQEAEDGLVAVSHEITRTLFGVRQRLLALLTLQLRGSALRKNPDRSFGQVGVHQRLPRHYGNEPETTALRIHQRHCEMSLRSRLGQIIFQDRTFAVGGVSRQGTRLLAGHIAGFKSSHHNEIGVKCVDQLPRQRAKKVFSRVAPDAFGNFKDDAFQIANGVHSTSSILAFSDYALWQNRGISAPNHLAGLPASGSISTTPALSYPTERASA